MSKYVSTNSYAVCIKELRQELDIAHISVEAMAEIKATIDGESTQTVRHIVDGAIHEIRMLREKYTFD